MNTSELTGAALDSAVAKCEGFDPETLNTTTGVVYSSRYGVYRPSTDWSQGGPIIEREGISITQFKEGEVDDCDVGMWDAAYARDDFGNDAKSSIGPTPLIAAMRCFVASRLGDEVEIPKELT